MYELDEDTAVQQVGPGMFRGQLTHRWDIGPSPGIPNGGYVLSIALAAIRQALRAPDPLTVTAHFLRPSTAGPARIEVDTAKIGRQYSTASARLLQADKENVRVLATYGDLSADRGPVHVFGAPPALPRREALTSVASAVAPEFARRVEIRPVRTIFDPVQAGEQPELSGWLRFADGRPIDVHALALIADAFPPVALRVLPPGWVPTIELTVHVRARPVSEWVRCIFRTRFIFGGLLEEDGEIWDENGTLLALSRQLAAVPRT